MENILFVFITLSFLSLMGAHVYFTNRFFDRLKEAHASVWKELGQPRWKIHFGDPSFQIAMKYIRSRQFTVLNDSTLDMFYQRIKLIEKSAVGLALLIIIVTIVDVLT